MKKRICFVACVAVLGWLIWEASFVSGQENARDEIDQRNERMAGL